MRSIVIIVIGFLFFLFLILTSNVYRPTSIFAQTPTPDPCALQNRGDANCNGAIDGVDFEVWRSEYSGALTTKTADFNKDDKVNLVDFEVWRKGFKGE